MAGGAIFHIEQITKQTTAQLSGSLQQTHRPQGSWLNIRLEIGTS